MRTLSTIPVLTALVALLAASPVLAEEILLAKVYRDYPGYINPAVCENPNIDNVDRDKPPAGKSGTSPVAPGGKSILSPSIPAEVDAPAVSPRPDDAVSPEMNRCCGASDWWLRADDPVDTPYLTVWGGVVATREVGGGAAMDVSVDNGYGLGVAGGYDFGPARIEIEGSYRDSNVGKLKVNGVVAGGSGDLQIQALMINGFADFKTGGMVTPYVGAGVGYAKVELNHDDDSVPAGQVSAGVLIALSPSVAIDLGYRFMATDDPEIQGQKIKIRQHSALLGVQFRF